MNQKKPFKLGVVEGFFGLPWSWETRFSYADFLVDAQFTTYIYAPKSDNYLRKDWQVAFPPDHASKLKTLSAHYSSKQLDFGIGLSPFELYRDFNSSKKRQLIAKIEEINAINPNILCILFDDMVGEQVDLAQQQVDIMDFVLSHSTASHFVMCPTYYSDDPKLARYFGTPPSNYLEDLGQLLESSIDIFWTGPKVISKKMPVEHIISTAEKLQRKPMIWDNYPVNDAENLANFLHTKPFTNRDKKLKELCSGHIANPMNQAFLSEFPLLNLSHLYNSINEDQVLNKRHSTELINLLKTDSHLFQKLGLASLNATQKEELVQRYSAFSQDPMAIEVIDWLKGKYVFDPNCLT